MGVYGGIQLPKISENTLDDRKERKQILNYLALLDEKLRYMFQNIDIEENLSADSQEMFFKYGKDIQNVIKDTEGRFSLFEQTINGISMAVQDNEGNISLLQQTATSLSSSIASAEGKISTLEQTAGRIETNVSELDDELGTVSSTATQTAKQIGWIVKSGTSASSMTLTDKFLEIVSDNITVKADIDLYGFMTVWRTDAMSSRGGYIGYSTGDDGVNASTSGCAVSSTDCDHYLLATNSGIRMTADTNAVVVMDSQISATEEISISSDERVKNSISYDMDKYDAFFEKLKPSFYRYNAGQSGRFHVGFIAQDVEQAIKEGGITTQDFAGLIQLKEKAEMLDGYEDQYYLRYENFIALNTHMIQKLMARVTELENKLEALS